MKTETLETIYGKLPTPLQNLACSLEGWKINRQRLGDNFRQYLSHYENHSTWTHKKTTEYRDKRLKNFLIHCRDSVPYYRDLFKTLGINVEDIRGICDLKVIPVLTKETVQRRYDDFLSESVSSKDHIVCHTSGTTGGGLRFASTSDAIAEQYAVWWRYRRAHGITMGTWCAYFGGRSIVPVNQTKPPFWRTNYPGRQIMFSAYHMNASNMEHYINKLNQSKPPWIHGYPSSIALLASFMLDKNIHLTYKPSWLTIGAENLMHHQATIIEKAFEITPVQHYGMAEGVANISQTIEGTLVVDEDFSAVEFEPTSSPDEYRIIGTNFTNTATPLIRYDTGDLVRIDNKISSTSGVREVSFIDGRNEDYVVLHNGVKVGRLDHIFKDHTRIKEAQILQKRVGALTIHIVRAKSYTNIDEQNLRLDLQNRLGKSTEIVIHYKNELQRTSNGKLRFVISEIENPSYNPNRNPLKTSNYDKNK